MLLKQNKIKTEMPGTLSQSLSPFLWNTKYSPLLLLQEASPQYGSEHCVACLHEQGKNIHLISL